MSIRQKNNGADFVHNGKNFKRRMSSGSVVFDLESSGGSGASVTTDPNPPANPNDGDLWYDTINAGLYVWDIDMSAWIQTNGGGGGGSAGGGYGSFGQYVSDFGVITGNTGDYSNSTWLNTAAIPNYDPNSMYAYWFQDHTYMPVAGADAHVIPIDIIFADRSEILSYLEPESSRPTTGVLGNAPTTPVRFVDQNQQQEIPGRGDTDSTGLITWSWGYQTYLSDSYGGPLNDQDRFDAPTYGGISSGDHKYMLGGGGYHERHSSAIGAGVAWYVRKSDGMIRILKTSGIVKDYKMVWFKLNTTSLGCLRYTTAVGARTPINDLPSNKQGAYHFRWTRTSATHNIND